MKRLFSLLAIFACAYLAGCATNIKSSASFNPPPAEIFSAFDRFELRPVALAPEFASNDANQRAAAKIQEHFDNQLKPMLESWNARKKSGGRTLLVEPRIEQIKFIGGGARFFAGALAGSSAVVMKVKYTESGSGKTVAHPEFFQRAAAMSGAMTLGAQDNDMLSRIVALVTDYTLRNFSEPLGGPTGMP